jgi:hypothetical protein
MSVRHPDLVSGLLASAILLATLCSPASAQAHPASPGPGARFEENRGAYDPAARFVSHHGSVTGFVRDGGLDLVLRGEQASVGLTARYVGALSGTSPEGRDRTPTVVHHLRGDDPARWTQDAPTYARVRWPEVWPQIDVELYQAAGGFEYDLRLAPGADLSAVQIAWEGQQAAWLDEQGALVLETAAGPLVQQPPVVFQADGTPVDGRFRLLGAGRVGFEVDAYDASQLLVVDPVLSFAAYAPGDAVRDVAVGSGPRPDIHVLGETTLVDLPAAPGVLQEDLAGGTDAWIAKLDHSGNVVRWITYLGGNDTDLAAAMDIAPDGSIVVGGKTYGTDFPVTAGAHDVTSGGIGGFVASLSPDGTSLNWATYIATHVSGGGEVRDLAVDPTGDVHLVGTACTCTDFAALPGAHSPSSSGGGTGWAARMASDGSQLEMATWIAHPDGSQTNNQSIPTGVAFDDGGRTLVAGYSYTQLATTANALAPGSLGAADGFVAVFAPDGSADYLSYVGGSGPDWYPAFVASGGGDRVWLAIETGSQDGVTTPDAWQAPGHSHTDVLLMALDVSRSGAASLEFSTYIGVDQVHESLTDLKSDAEGAAVLTYVGYPWTPLIDSSAGQGHGSTDVMVVVARPDFTIESFTQLGWSSAEAGARLDLDEDGGIVLGGTAGTVVEVGTAAGLSPDRNAFLARLSRERAWMDLGRGFAGGAGTPRLSGEGDLSGGSLASLHVSDALPSGLACLAVGTVLSDLPAKGGLLVPDPFVIVPGLALDGLGQLDLDLIWPSGLAPGTRFFAQVWVQDPGALHGYAATNGLAATAP